MLRLTLAARNTVRRNCLPKCMATLTATEEFPFSATITESKAAPAVITESSLANGIKLISKDYGSSKVVSLNIVVKGGSRLESLSEKGAAHLLSVTAFSGHSKKSGIRMMRDLENLGAVVSSSSDQEKITYNLSVLSDKLEAAFETVADAVILAPHLPHVIEDRKSTAQLAYDKRSSPEGILSELLFESMFGEATPLGSSLYANSLDDLSINNTNAYRNRVFLSGNLAVIGSGISHTTLQKLVEKYICLPGGSTPFPASPYVGGDNKVRIHLGVTHAGLAFGIPSNADSTKIVQVLSHALTARLTSSAVKAKGYNITPYSVNYSSTSAVGFYVKASPAQVAANLQLALDELRIIASGGATSQLELAKSQLSLAAALSLEGEAPTATMVNAFLTGQTVKSAVDFKGLDVKKVELAASALLAAVPSYAVVGTTVGAPSAAVVASICKRSGVVPAL